MTAGLSAKPQINVPAPKSIFETTRPVRLENMSVRRPLSGCIAAFAMRYALASHDSKVKELNEFEIGADNVATIVESTGRQPSILKEVLQKNSFYLER